VSGVDWCSCLCEWCWLAVMLVWVVFTAMLPGIYVCVSCVDCCSRLCELCWLAFMIDTQWQWLWCRSWPFPTTRSNSQMLSIAWPAQCQEKSTLGQFKHVFLLLFCFLYWADILSPLCAGGHWWASQAVKHMSDLGNQHNNGLCSLLSIMGQKPDSALGSD